MSPAATAPPGGDREFVVRDARPDDYGAISDLTVAVYVAEGFAGPGYAESLANVADRAASTDLIVADSSGRVIGAVALAARGGPYAELAGPDEAGFRMLVVDPSWRGLGVASALVQECLRRARALGRRRVVISTGPEMRAAHRLYERLGFVRLPDRDWCPRPGLKLLAYGREL